MHIEQAETTSAAVTLDDTGDGDNVGYLHRADEATDEQWADALAVIDQADAVIAAAREIVHAWASGHTSRPVLAGLIDSLDAALGEIEDARDEFMPESDDE